jgi:hypothetical protein
LAQIFLKNHNGISTNPSLSFPRGTSSFEINGVSTPSEVTGVQLIVLDVHEEGFVVQLLTNGNSTSSAVFSSLASDGNSRESFGTRRRQYSAKPIGNTNRNNSHNTVRGVPGEAVVGVVETGVVETGVTVVPIVEPGVVTVVVVTVVGTRGVEPGVVTVVVVTVVETGVVEPGVVTVVEVTVVETGPVVEPGVVGTGVVTGVLFREDEDSGAKLVCGGVG